MKKLVSALILCVFIGHNGLPQSQEMMISAQANYYPDENELKALMTHETKSTFDYKNALSYRKAGIITFAVGAGLIAVGFIGINNSEDAHKSFFKGGSSVIKYFYSIVAGGGLCIVGLPMIIWGNGNSRKSKRSYHSTSSPPVFRNEMKMDIGISQNGVGMFYGF
jgi:hypothetical protein